MSTATLPDKPSELIRVALADLRKVEAMPETYTVDMWMWHRPSVDGRCSVCLAGAVMASRLGASPLNHVWPSAHGLDTRVKLDAIDDFRMGAVAIPLKKLRLPVPSTIPKTVDVADYADDPEAFHRDMHALADDLEAAGL